MAFAPVPFMEWQRTPSAPGVLSLNSSNVGFYPSEGLVPDPGALSCRRHPYSRFGMDALREKLSRTYGVPVDEILLTSGTTFANYLALFALAEPGQKVALESPLYEPLLGAAQALDLEVLTFRRPPELGFRPALDDVARVLAEGARVVVLTDLYNPAGVPLLDEDAEAIAGMCSRQGAWLMVDEVYRDFSHLDHPRSRRSAGGPFVCTGSLTKVYGLSYLRAGWLFAPRAVLQRALAVTSVILPEIPMPCQMMALTALEQRREIGAWAQGIVEPNLAMIQRFVSVEPRLSGVVPEVGSIWFPLLPEGVDGDHFCRELLSRHQVRVAPGSFFGLPRGMRIGLGVESDLLRQGLARIKRLLDELEIPGG